MQRDENIFLLFGDLGYAMLDEHREKYPDRCINTGASEQAMMDIAVGLALSGVIPVVYSITSFLLYRPFETIRTYINEEKIPVKLVGGGRDKDYKHDGFSHDASDDRDIIYTQRNIVSYWPETNEKVSKQFVQNILYNGKPTYLNLKR
jgi:transketolase